MNEFTRRIAYCSRTLRRITASAALLALAGLCTVAAEEPAVKKPKPRVIVTTDINIMRGDPDDRQSLIHLFFYLDELEVKAIVADRSTSPRTGALEACRMAADCYERDYNNPKVKLKAKGFPTPARVRAMIRPGGEAGSNAIVEEARRDDPRPLYILAWGSMSTLGRALKAAPEIAPRLRVLSIGTFNNPNAPHPPGANSGGRDEIFIDPRFRAMWWIENSEMFVAMFSGLKYGPTQGAEAPQGGGKPGDRTPTGGPPAELLREVAKFGALGKHMTEVTQGNDWARYFRAGDTPSVLYLLDPSHDPDKPEQPGWAGVFEKPYPKERPNHWTDASWGMLNYDEPAKTKGAEAEVRKRQREVFLKVRPQVYEAFLAKLRELYGE